MREERSQKVQHKAPVDAFINKLKHRRREITNLSDVKVAASLVDLRVIQV